MTATCKTCRFFVQQKDYSGGHCKRYPPTYAVATTASDDIAHWNEFPYVPVSEWCGEHETAPPTTDERSKDNSIALYCSDEAVAAMKSYVGNLDETALAEMAVALEEAFKACPPDQGPTWRRQARIAIKTRDRQLGRLTAPVLPPTDR